MSVEICNSCTQLQTRLAGASCCVRLPTRRLWCGPSSLGYGVRLSSMRLSITSFSSVSFFQRKKKLKIKRSFSFILATPATSAPKGYVGVRCVMCQTGKAAPRMSVYMCATCARVCTYVRAYVRIYIYVCVCVCVCVCSVCSVCEAVRYIHTVFVAACMSQFASHRTVLIYIPPYLRQWHTA